ncbi:MAG TPA: hypothetical protein VHZ09_03740 [Acidobacteriaceae bacterium]|nr:hypothetical protein [Acidobacteriaceae bacterium]
MNRKGQRGADGKTLAYYADSLSGFDETAVRLACDEINGQPVDRYHPWPNLEYLKGLCRKHSPRADTAWTLERYREALYLNRAICERIREGETREAVLAELNQRFPSVAPMWAAWRRQTDDGSIQVPAKWCDRCEGFGMIHDHATRKASPCYCRRQTISGLR